MTLQGKALVTKTEELSSIPGAHMVEGENQAPPNDLHLLRVGTWPLCWEMSSMLAILEEIEMERETEEQEGGEVKREGGGEMAIEKWGEEWGYNPVFTLRLRTFPKQACQTISQRDTKWFQVLHSLYPSAQRTVRKWAKTLHIEPRCN